jgi:hypothetical protein
MGGTISKNIAGQGLGTAVKISVLGVIYPSIYNRRVNIMADCFRPTELSKTKYFLFSSVIKITSGVPQGSIFGPALFLRYVNDLADCFCDLNCAVKQYTDDAKLQSSFTLNYFSVDLVPALHCLIARQLPIASRQCFVHRLTSRAVRVIAVITLRLAHLNFRSLAAQKTLVLLLTTA